MAHRRNSIMAQLKTQLINAATQAGSRVFRSITLPVEQTDLPCILIRMMPGQLAERIERDDVNYFVTRTLTLMVVLKMKDLPADAEAPDIEADLNDFGAEVENAIQADTELNNLALDTEVTGFFTDLAGANVDFGDGVVMVQIKYRTKRTDASQP